MKYPMLVIVMAALLAGCATTEERGMGGGGTEYGVVEGQEIVGVPGGANEPKVMGYEDVSREIMLEQRPGYGFGPPDWTGIFMPDFVSGRPMRP